MFEGLVILGRKFPDEKTVREMTDYLQYSLDTFGYGCRFFDVDKLPEGLNHRHLAEFARLINLFCIELTKTQSELEATRIDWSFARRMDFLARLMNMYSLIGDVLREKGIEIPKQEIPLSTEEKITVERERLLAVHRQTKHRLNNSEQFESWEKIAKLYEQDKTFTDLEILSLVYSISTELIDDSVSKEKKISIYKRFLKIRTQIGDKEDIELIGGIIEDIEKE